MKGVKVKIKKGNFPVPFGLEYNAKGAYVQGKYIVVVGNLKNDSTIRVKYPLDNIDLTFF